MTDRLEQAKRLQATMNTIGWDDFVSIAREHIDGPYLELREMAQSRPDHLTGKTAIAKANRAKGVEDLLEDLNDRLKILIPTRKGGS